MKALAIHGKEDIRWEDRSDPVPTDGQVRLRVGYVGICGSDLHYYFHGANGENVVREPFTPGHEFAFYLAKAQLAYRAVTRVQA